MYSREEVVSTEYTKWQWPFSGVHSIVMVKSAQHDEGGGARPPPFTLSTIMSKVVVYTPAEMADTLPLFLLYPYMNSVVVPQHVMSSTEVVCTFLAHIARTVRLLYHETHSKTIL